MDFALFPVISLNTANIVNPQLLQDLFFFVQEHYLFFRGEHLVMVAPDNSTSGGFHILQLDPRKPR